MEIDLANAGQYVSDYWTQHPVLRAMAAAFLVGVIGSAAYLVALLFGYLGDLALDQLGSKFETAKGTRVSGLCGGVQVVEQDVWE